MTPVDEIKARIDIVSYIQKGVSLKKAGRLYKACCPFHAEKTPSFTVDPDRGTWHCFGACNTGGDVFSFAMKQHGWSFSEALEALGKEAGVDVRSQSPRQKAAEAQMDKLRGILSEAATWYHAQLLSEHPLAQETRRYLTDERGLSLETITAWQLGYALPGWSNWLDEALRLGYSREDLMAAGLVSKNETRHYDRFRHRLMIPIADERGRVVGFGARSLDPADEPKYLNSPESVLFAKSKLLFGLHAAREAIRATGSAVIVEGYMDVIQAHQAGHRNVVAQMGTALTPEQAYQLRGAGQIVIALDGDAAGQTATRRSLEIMVQVNRDIRVMTLPEGVDPDDAIREGQWAGLIDQAEPVTNWLITRAVENLPANASPHQRLDVAKALIPVLLKAESDVIRHDAVQTLAMRLSLPVAQVLEMPEMSPAPEIGLVKKPELLPKSGIELNILRTLIETPALVNFVNQVLASMTLLPLEVTDFPQSGQLAETVLTGQARVGEVEGWETLERYGLSLEKRPLVSQVCQLRLNRLTSEVDSLLALDDLEQGMARLKLKAILQEYMQRIAA